MTNNDLTNDPTIARGIGHRGDSLDAEPVRRTPYSTPIEYKADKDGYPIR